MTRFMITLDEGVKLVWHSFSDMIGGEIYVKKILYGNIDIARAIDETKQSKVVGIRLVKIRANDWYRRCSVYL